MTILLVFQNNKYLDGETEAASGGYPGRVGAR